MGWKGASAVAVAATGEHLDDLVDPRRIPRGDHLARAVGGQRIALPRSEEHTSELQSLMRISYAVFCLKKKKINKNKNTTTRTEEQTQNTTRHHKIQVQAIHS